MRRRLDGSKWFDGSGLFEEVIEKFDDWTIKLMVEENGINLNIAFLFVPTLQGAQKLADAVEQKYDACDGRCGEWTRV